jgi:LCP family protein required for cell wall assembly
MEALRQTLEVLLGIPIDAYVLVDFAGFVDLVDALGGVRVTVTESLHEVLSPAREGEGVIAIDVEPGVHVLDGHQALAYVRDRTGSSDGERMRRQRCMVRELAASADAGTLLRAFPDISRAIRASTTTTLSLDLLPEIIDALAGLDPDDIATLAIGGQFSSRKNYLNLPIIEPDRVRAAVAGLLAGVAEGTTLGSADECS